jgi:hypothetical protein
MLTTCACTAAAARLPDEASPNARRWLLEPEAALAQSIGLQGYIYGYPLVDLLKQRFNETHRVSGTSRSWRRSTPSPSTRIC